MDENNEIQLIFEGWYCEKEIIFAVVRVGRRFLSKMRGKIPCITPIPITRVL
jgi:hypothetical protein